MSDTWEEVSEGIFVNKESWEHRLARYQKTRVKLQEIMDEKAEAYKERMENEDNAKGT